jgi:hypothetical protein
MSQNLSRSSTRLAGPRRTSSSASGEPADSGAVLPAGGQVKGVELTGQFVAAGLGETVGGAGAVMVSGRGQQPLPSPRVLIALDIAGCGGDGEGEPAQVDSAVVDRDELARFVGGEDLCGGAWGCAVAESGSIGVAGEPQRLGLAQIVEGGGVGSGQPGRVGFELLEQVAGVAVLPGPGAIRPHWLGRGCHIHSGRARVGLIQQPFKADRTRCTCSQRPGATRPFVRVPRAVTARAVACEVLGEDSIDSAGA